MAEADESSSASAGSVAVAAQSVGTAASGVTKGTEDEDALQKVEEIDYHPECSVCLQPSYYPVKLPCGHIFCFLCIKGVALRSKKCALCRQAITPDFFENPTLVKIVGTTTKEAVPKCSKIEQQQDIPCPTAVESASEELEYVWFYEGRNGWWQYDEKTSSEVEKAFKSGKRSCTLLIAGFLYTVDFENMFQTRKQEPGRRRRIKRDKPDAESKGVAGIRAVCKRPANVDAKSTEGSSTKNDGRQESGAAGGSSGDTTGTIDGPRTQEKNDSDNNDQMASRLEAA